MISFLRSKSVLGIGLALSMVLPMVMVVPGIIHQFTMPKAVLFFILVDLLVIIALFSKQGFAKALFKSPLVIVMTLMLGFSLLSGVWGESFIRSLMGTSTRMTGILASAHFLLFFLLSSRLLTFDLWKKILKSLIVLSILPAILTLVQFFFPGFLDLVGDQQMGGFFGNKAYAGYYLLIHVFFSLWLWKRAETVFERRCFGAILGLLVLTLLFLNVRGMYIGILSGLLVIGISFLAHFWKNRSLHPGWHKKAGIALLVIFFGTLLITGILKKIEAGYPESRIAKAVSRVSNFSFEDKSVQNRLVFWKIGLQALRDRPLLGWGPENFELALNRHYDPELLRFGPSDSWSDRAHNAFIQTVVELGVLGGVLFLLFWGLVFFHARHDSILFALLFSVFIVSLIEVESFTALILIFFVVSFLVSKKIPENAERWTPNSPSAFFIGILMVFLAGTAGLYFTSSFLMERAIRSDLISLRADRFMARFDRGYDMAFPFSFLQSEESGNAMMAFMRVISAKKVTQIPLPLFVFLEEHAENALKNLSRSEIRHPYILSQLLTQWGNADGEKLKKAGQLVKKALAINDQRQMLLFQQGEILLSEEKKVPSLVVLQKLYDVILLEPRSSYAHWYLGKMYLRYQISDGAVRELEKGLELGYVIDGISEIDQVSPLLSSGKRWKALNKLYQQAISFYPYRGSLHAKLAVSYLTIGDHEKAKNHALRALELDPLLAKSPGSQEVLKALGLE